METFFDLTDPRKRIKRGDMVLLQTGEIVKVREILERFIDSQTAERILISDCKKQFRPEEVTGFQLELSFGA